MESNFTELLPSSISYTLSSTGCLAGEVLSGKVSLFLRIVLASEKASFSPPVSCSLLVEQIHESGRPELVLQAGKQARNPPGKPRGTYPNPHSEETGFARKITFSHVICTTNKKEAQNFSIKRCLKFYSAIFPPPHGGKDCKNLMFL